jgi:ribosomal protein S18 acetylase RimI-like enzyme
MARLLKDAFEGSAGQYGQRNLEAHMSSTESFLKNYDIESLCGQASALIYEKATGTMVALCMVELHKNLPAIRFVAVAPDYQKRGLATHLLKRATEILESKYNWVKLAVTVTNPAVNLYRRLGFISGDALHELSKSAS